jgi:hypothetical protein
MKPLLCSFIGVLLTCATCLAQEKLNSDGLMFGGAGTQAAGVTVSVPPTVTRGSVVPVSASYAPLTVPLNANCILLLPVNSPAYKEVILYSRKYNSVGVSAHGCPMYIPPYIQFQGKAIVVVTVDGAGVGVATFDVTP